MMTPLHLFICTANTCRSQMAQALAQHDFPQHKYSSAGLAAKAGAPTSDHAVALLAQAGIIWQGKSQAVTPDLLLHHDHIWVMTQAHRRQLLEQLSTWQISLSLSKKITCLAGLEDIQDPYGGHEGTYAQCFRLIRQSLRRNLGEQ